MQQGVSITGGGLQLFATAIACLDTIRSIFNQELNSGILDNHTSPTFQDHLSMDASNRYFTLKQNILNDDHLQFLKVVDPRNILESLKGQDLVYGPENVVEYYKAANNRQAFATQ